MLRQLGLIALVVAVWGILFVGYLRLTKDSPTAQTNTAAGAATPTAAPAIETPTSPPVGESTVSFAGDVLPILENRCVKCHGGQRTNSGLVLNTFDSLLAGSANGPVITPGSAADSILVQQIVAGDMPKREPGLLPAEIQTISDWVDAGAPNN